MSNQTANTSISCEEDLLSISNHRHESHSPTVLYPAIQDQQSHQIISPPQPQQRVHVIKKNIYLMTASNSNNNTTNCASTSSNSTVMIFKLLIIEI